MPHPSRVTPFNELIATPARGNLMGNRGILHDERRTLTHSWRILSVVGVTFSDYPGYSASSNRVKTRLLVIALSRGLLRLSLHLDWRVGK